VSGGVHDSPQGAFDGLRAPEACDTVKRPAKAKRATGGSKLSAA
jgi:hypothetical protein